MSNIPKTIFQAVIVLLGTAVAVGIFAFAFWLMIPLAFPALEFSYWNALALSWLLFLIGLPSLLKN